MKLWYLKKLPYTTLVSKMTPLGFGFARVAAAGGVGLTIK
jgi:hypothetical protein